MTSWVNSGLQRFWMLGKQSQEVYGVCNNGPERDYLIATLDRRLAYIFGDELIPFAERYPMVVPPKPIGKRRTKWRRRKKDAAGP